MSNKAVLQYPNKRQYIITVPKGLVMAKGWEKGDKMEFVIDKSGSIIIKRAKQRGK